MTSDRVAEAAHTYFDSLAQSGVRLGLENIRRLAARLGEPQRAFAAIHIAGTNGKGSVAAFVERALRAAGHRTGALVSPRLIRDADQIRIDGDAVDDAAFARAVLQVREAAVSTADGGAIEPTQFEVLTAAAFDLFREHGVEIAVVEAGLGGELDATNIITPLAAGITSVSRDHTELLGDTLPSIARHKAGIIKPGAPVVIAPLPADAEQVVREIATERGCRVVRADEGCDVSVRMEHGRAILEVQTPAGRYGPLTLALRGEHQAGNALVALRLLEEVRAAGVSMSNASIETGLTQASWPARLELIAFPGGRRLLIDAAHNPAGARALADYLRHWHAEPVPFVFGVMKDKDVAAILALLLPVVGPIVVTAAATPRASPPEEVAAVVRSLDGSRLVTIEADPVRAVEHAWTHASDVCVAGSIALAGAVRGAFHARAIVDSSP